MNILNKILSFLIVLGISATAFSQDETTLSEKESEYYKIIDVPIPDDITLSVGGLALNDKDQLGVSTRRGDVWLIDKPYSQNPSYKRFATGMHEILGLAYTDNGFYLSQRGELTRIEDKDNDGKADLYKTIYSWPLSANYHDYSYGPKITPNGDLLVTLNLGWIGRGASLSKWRGWMLQITPEGEMTPIATGLRSPAGFGINPEGDYFYTENQGDWVGSGRMTHLTSGDFAGNPAGLRWTDDPKSPLKLKPEDILPNSGFSLYEYAKQIPELKAPAIWFPHTLLGISTSDILYENEISKFGPFEGQMYVGDQGHSKIMRVYMEKINGVYQGASFNFREGFSSGVLRMIWGSDSSMFVGMTSRGWSSTGEKEYGLQRLVWSGKTPFEIKTIKAQNDGFLLEFTEPVDKITASKTTSYSMESFTYQYRDHYGSPILDKLKGMIHKVEVSEDGLSAKLTIHGMRLGFIHQIHALGVKSQSGEALLHDKGYYTLNEVPGGVLKSPSMQMTNTGKKSNQKKRVNKMPENWGNKTDERLVVGTVPGLKFDTEEIIVNRNSKIELTFNNNDDMIHNLVITQQGEDSVDKVGKMGLALGLDGPSLNYVPNTDLVLFHTGILKPGTTEKIYFQAPGEPGEYWIVCTFPGHYTIMRAKLIVR